MREKIFLPLLREFFSRLRWIHNLSENIGLLREEVPKSRHLSGKNALKMGKNSGKILCKTLSEPCKSLEKILYTLNHKNVP